MKILKENYKRFFAGRGVNTAGAFNDSKLIKEKSVSEGYYDMDMNWVDDPDHDQIPAEEEPLPIVTKNDYLGMVEELGDLFATVEEVHRSVTSPIENAAAEIPDPQYDMQEKQVSRYFQTIFKSIENLQKFLEKQSRRV